MDLSGYACIDDEDLHDDRYDVSVKYLALRTDPYRDGVHLKGAVAKILSGNVHFHGVFPIPERIELFDPVAIRMWARARNSAHVQCTYIESDIFDEKIHYAERFGFGGPTVLSLCNTGDTRAIRGLDSLVLSVKPDYLITKGFGMKHPSHVMELVRMVDRCKHVRLYIEASGRMGDRELHQCECFMQEMTESYGVPCLYFEVVYSTRRRHYFYVSTSAEGNCAFFRSNVLREHPKMRDALMDSSAGHLHMGMNARLEELGAMDRGELI